MKKNKIAGRADLTATTFRVAGQYLAEAELGLGALASVNALIARIICNTRVDGATKL